MKRNIIKASFAGLLVCFGLLGASCSPTTNQNEGGNESDVVIPDDNKDPKPEENKEPEPTTGVTTLSKETCVTLVNKIKEENQKVYTVAGCEQKLNNISYKFAGEKVIGFCGDFPNEEYSKLNSFQVKVKGTTQDEPLISTLTKVKPVSIEISYLHANGEAELPELLNAFVDETPLSYATSKNEDTTYKFYETPIYRNVTTYVNTDELKGILSFNPESKYGPIHFEYIKITY